MLDRWGRVIRAIAIAFAVRLIVMRVVTDQILQGEAIVCRNKVNTGVRPAATAGVEVAGTGNAIGEFSDYSAVAFPV